MTPKLPSSLFTGPLFQTAGATVSEFSRQTQIEREKKYEQEFDHFWHGDADGHLCLANERSLLIYRLQELMTLHKNSLSNIGVALLLGYPKKPRNLAV